ncbi:MAG: hypothetical protein AVDCRST_MAG80-2633, partial [uncultured Rubrobacteraceae bacterium]
ALAGRAPVQRLSSADCRCSPVSRRFEVVRRRYQWHRLRVPGRTSAPGGLRRGFLRAALAAGRGRRRAM